MIKEAGIGILAGLAGTAALTAVVQLERTALPFGQKHNALFPHKVIKKAEYLFGFPGRFSGKGEAAAIHGASFLYGGAMGSLYGWWSSQTKVSPWISGPLYGLALWGIGLAGWVPALGAQRPPWKKTPMQAAMPVVAHLAYGLAAAAMVRIFQEKSRADRKKRLVSV